MVRPTANPRCKSLTTSKEAQESLIHEAFHHYAKAHPNVFDQVIQTIGWIEVIDEYGFKSFELRENTLLPSPYAFHDEMESFAEVMMFYGQSYDNADLFRQWCDDYYAAAS